jgi:hypothetical protein
MKSPVPIGMGPIEVTWLQLQIVSGDRVDITLKTENFNMYLKADSGKLGLSIKKLIPPEFPRKVWAA